MKNETIVLPQHLRQIPKVRFVTPVEERRKSARSHDLAIRQPIDHRVDQIRRPLLRGVIHHDVEIAGAQELLIARDFSRTAADSISGSGKFLDPDAVVPAAGAVTFVAAPCLGIGVPAWLGAHLAAADCAV